MADQGLGLTQEERLALFERGLHDPVFFCQTFLADWFPSEVPPLHKGLMAVLTRQTEWLENDPDLPWIIENFIWKEDWNDSAAPERPIFGWEDGQLVLYVGQYTLQMIPRGMAKTTIVNAMLLREALYRLRNFILMLSETGPHAETQLGNIKQQLESNALILEVFGPQVPERGHGKWTENWAELRNGVNIRARGRGAQVRGSNIDGQRPDHIVLDDVEDEESVKTAAQREKTLSWVYGAVMPAQQQVGVVDLEWAPTIDVLGTLLHPEAMIMKLRDDREFTSIVFGVYDRAGAPIWPAHTTKEKDEARKERYAKQGLLHVYYMEYHNVARAPEKQLFKPENFRFNIQPKYELYKSLAIDPAISEEADSDFCAYSVVGMERGGYFHVLHCDGERGMSPRDQVEEYFRLSKTYRTHKHGVEAVAYQSALIHLLREDMFRQKHYFEIEPIRHSQRKSERIRGVLAPRFANGFIIFQRRFTKLEAQLLDYGAPGSHDDFPDVLAMAIALLDPYAAQAADPLKDLGEDVYEPLQIPIPV